jgi:hypothetical protein
MLWDIGTGQEAFSQRTGPESMAGDAEFDPAGDRLVVTRTFDHPHHCRRSVLARSRSERAVIWHMRSATACESDQNWRADSTTIV